jgi:hypothetical protein
MTARWEQALDALLDLYLFSVSPRGRMSAAAWAEAVMTEDPDGRGRGIPDRLPERITGMAFNAEPIWVDPDLQTLWEAATQTFEPETLHPQDLITENGFVYLPRPYISHDVHGRETSMRAFGWTRQPITYQAVGDDLPPSARYTLDGVALYLFHQVGDRDYYDGGDGTSHATEADYHVTHPDDHGHMRPREIKWSDVGLRRGDLVIDHVYAWPFGQRTDGTVPVQKMAEGDFVYNAAAAEAAPPPGRLASPDGDVRRPAQCLWRLMQQTIATRSTERAGGQFRRRWERQKLAERKVTVIRLRRPRTPTPDGHEVREVEWSHRWLVSGHWRNQWYSTINGHRQIWISPYIKGPEDRPLEVRKLRVFELVQ